MLRLFVALFLLTFFSIPALAEYPDCKDIPLSDEPYLQALAEQGSARAKYDLAKFYDKKENLLQHVPSLITDSIAVKGGYAPAEEKLARADKELVWLQKAAEQGYAKALFEVGRLYRDLASHESQYAQLPEDPLTQAISPQVDKFYQEHDLLKRTTSGVTTATFPNQQRSVEFVARAMQLYHEAATQGDVDAHYELAWCYGGR
jgi:TPR repeat protein